MFRPGERTAMHRLRGTLVVTGLALPLALCAGCPPPPGGDGNELPVLNNTTDSTNGGATYVGSEACGACHGSTADLVRVHGHSQALHPIEGTAPDYPSEGARASVPDPPDGKSWTDVSYVISGYLHNALFIDSAGFLLTDGVDGVETQWNLPFSANGSTAGFAPYRPEQSTPLPYEFECFSCHTTGPVPQTSDRPLSQEGRPGIRGTWAEEGVRCEACHGPGSNHVPNPAARDLFVDSTVQACAGCHLAGGDPNVILSAEGFINPNTQYAELRASGGHAGFDCTFCHDPHASVVYDRAQGIRNECAACHRELDLALHERAVFVRGFYTEPVTCESCHMPFGGKSATAATETIVGATGRMGDVRSHIFRIATGDAGTAAMFSADGSRVVKDDQGRAALTVNFVCLRCHTDETAVDNSAFPLSPEFASEIASRMHARLE
jgi:hypothetical protein